jgi:hypothetical protein
MAVERLSDAYPTISLHEPWLWAVQHFGKQIENRPWWASRRGPIWLHRSLRPSQREINESLSWMRARGLVPPDAPPFPWEPTSIRWGGVVGYTEIDGVLPPTDGVLIDFHKAKSQIASFRSNVPNADRMLRWKMEAQYGFVLKNTRQIPFIACPGRQRWFYLPADVETRAREALAAAA